MTECHVLSQYPVSREFAREIEMRVGATARFTNLTGSTAATLRGLMRVLRSIDADIVVVAMEDGGAAASAPILQTLASLTRGRTLALMTPGGTLQPFSRLKALGAAADLAVRSVFAGVVLGATYFRLVRLRRAERINVTRPDSRHVLYINATLWFGLKAGGSIGHISGVVNGLSDRGYRVTFASAGGRLMTDQRSEFTELPAPAGFSFPPETNCYTFARRIRGAVEKMARATTFGVVYQRLCLGNATGVDISRASGLPLICEYNGSEAWVAKHWGRPLKFHRLAVLAEEVMLRHAHVVVTVSNVLKDDLIARGVEPERIVMYPNCIDPELFAADRFEQKALESLRARYGIPANALVATFIGTFGQWHGVDVLASAIRVLMDQHSDWLEKFKVRFLLVGDGAKMAVVQKILAHPKRDTFVVIAGLVPQAEAPVHLAASDVLVSPHVENPDGTRFFGSPTKLFEYMAMGRAIIASDLDQIGDVLGDSIRVENLPHADPLPDDRRLSVLTRPGEVNDLVEAFRFLIENPKWRETLGRCARQEALKNFTWGRHVDEIVIGYERNVPAR